MNGREIKFRYWDVVAEKMLDDDGFETNNLPDEVEVMQYTGLKDKNGKEIYEGDVVKPDPEHLVFKLKSPEWDLGKDYRLEYTAAEVMWQNSGWWIGQYYHGAVQMSEFALCDCCPCGLEVIGNAFENPDLVKFVERNEKLQDGNKESK